MALVVLRGVLLLRRYQWVQRVVSHGIPIKGLIEKIDVSTCRLPAEKHAPWTPRLIHTYEGFLLMTAAATKEKRG